MTDADLRILRSLWAPSRHQQVIAAELGITSVELARRGLRLLDDPDAEREQPVLVHRARRLLEQRRSRRGRR